MNWWKNGLQLKLQIRIYPDGLLIAAIYALACWATRQVSVDQFYLGAGIRVSALLLCPPRLWPYLILGEYAYFAHMRLPMIETHGAVWVTFGSVLLMPTAMYLVKLHRARIRNGSDAWMLSLAFSVAASITLLNVALSQLLWPVPPSLPPLSRAVRYLLGDFIGILTIAPIALLWIRRRPGKDWLTRRSVPTAACLSIMVLLGLGCAQLPPESTVERTTLQLLASLPAIALTCILGWPGAALAVPLLNVTVGLTMPTSNLPWSFDSATFTVQQILALASAALLSLGSTISGYYHRCLANAFSRSRTAALVRTSHYAGEMDLRHRALEINRIGDSVDRYLSETASWLKAQGHEQIAASLVRTSGIYSRKFREQASMVYPTALEHVGLYLTLQAGGISEAWSSTGCLVEPRLIGDPCRLTVPLQLATYRAVTEAVSLLLQRESGQVRINARCGRSGSRNGILIVVSMLDPRHRISDATREQAIETLSGRTMAYGGSVHCHRNRIRMLFLDPPCD